MKLKNAALQELYETIVNGTFTFSPYAEDPVDKAFEECDEKLSGSAIGTLMDANLDLCTKNRDLKDRNNQLKKELDAAKLSVEYFKTSRNDWRSRAKHEEEEKIEQVKRADNLKYRLDKANSDRDIWVRNNGEKQAEIAELKRRLETVNDSRYKWAQKWLSTKQNLETKLNEAEVKYRRLEKEHEELTSQYQELSIKLKRIQIDVGRESRHLWDMLQNVNDVKPEEFDPECETLGDILDMDLEDFLDCYKKWQEQKETERMRNWLDDFCGRRFCKGCPLESEEYKCGCGYVFRGGNPIPDKDIKRYYEKARGFDQCKRKNTTYYFDNEPVTFEASVKINADVLKIITD